MKIAAVGTTDPHPNAVIDVYEELEVQLGAAPNLLMLHCSALYDVEETLKTLRARVPGIPLHGGTSCLGVFTQAGPYIKDGRGLALFGVSDPEGSYGVGAAAMGENHREAARQATRAALEQADRPGEVPAIVCMTAAPGAEEALIAGVGDVLGEDVPVVGGSSADNTVSGGWRQFANDNVHNDAVVLTTLFPSTDVMFTFHSGYEPTTLKGTVTRAEGRILLEIGGRPAAEVYNEWVDGQIAVALPDGGNILSMTTLFPLGRVVGRIGGVPYYQLSHPDSVTAGRGMTLFTTVAPGDELILMHGTPDSLVTRAGRVAASVLETYLAQPDDVAGAFVIYCAGSMLAIEDRLNEVVESLQRALPATPFLGAFTFGEQGCFLNGENRHSNLMISALMFKK